MECESVCRISIHNNLHFYIHLIRLSLPPMLQKHRIHLLQNSSQFGAPYTCPNRMRVQLNGAKNVFPLHCVCDSCFALCCEQHKNFDRRPLINWSDIIVSDKLQFCRIWPICTKSYIVDHFAHAIRHIQRNLLYIFTTKRLYNIQFESWINVAAAGDEVAAPNERNRPDELPHGFNYKNSNWPIASSKHSG